MRKNEREAFLKSRCDDLIDVATLTDTFFSDKDAIKKALEHIYYWVRVRGDVAWQKGVRYFVTGDQ